MPKTYRCSFCGKTYVTGLGRTLIRNDGTVLYFCSSKCTKSESLGRDSRKLKWTVYHGKKERGK